MSNVYRVIKRSNGRWVVTGGGEMSRKAAFDEAARLNGEEPPVLSNHYDRGRSPKYGETMTQTGIRITADQLTWLKAQPHGVSETIRRLIDKAMQ